LKKSGHTLPRKLKKLPVFDSITSLRELKAEIKVKEATYLWLERKVAGPDPIDLPTKWICPGSIFITSVRKL